MHFGISKYNQASYLTPLIQESVPDTKEGFRWNVVYKYRQEPVEREQWHVDRMVLKVAMNSGYLLLDQIF